ncbi:MAG: hypothetical protein SVK08_11605 [Halobacteriota archaeon]|nr:hypothetical protein [Halobacteriota archaeon]
MTKEQLQDAFAKIAAEFQNETGFIVRKVEFTYIPHENKFPTINSTKVLLKTKVEVQ